MSWTEREERRPSLLLYNERSPKNTYAEYAIAKTTGGIDVGTGFVKTRRAFTTRPANETEGGGRIKNKTRFPMHRSNNETYGEMKDRLAAGNNGEPGETNVYWETSKTNLTGAERRNEKRFY